MSVLPRYEIRPIKEGSWALGDACKSQRRICSNSATHYLVSIPIGQPGRRESRWRRCERCAKEDAAILGIQFPKVKP